MGRRSRRSAALALLLLACGSHKTEPHGDGLARELLSRPSLIWQTASFRYGHLHAFPDSYAAAHTTEFADNVITARDSVMRLLAMNDTSSTLEIFLLDTRADMQRVVGRPMAGMVQQGERTALFVYNKGYRPAVLHELTHLYSLANWGIPAPGRWVSEGLATLATATCQGYSTDELAAGLMQRGIARDWRTVRDRFEELTEEVGYMESSSILRFVHSKQGIEGIKQIWQGDTAYLQLEPQWRKEISKLRPASVDENRVRREGC